MTVPWWTERFEANVARLPEFTSEQFFALVEVLALWFQIKAESEPRWTEEQRQCLRQLSPDVWHSALLQRMLVQHKLPLADPPALSHAYPVYPD